MNEQLKLDFNSQQSEEISNNMEQADAQAVVNQIEAEMYGAYSSLGNRHTYVIDSEGKKRPIKRQEALEKADEFVENYKEVSVNRAETEQEESEQTAGDAQASANTAEQRASELGQLLKAHDQKVLKAQLGPEENNESNPRVSRQLRDEIEASEEASRYSSDEISKSEEDAGLSKDTEGALSSDLPETEVVPVSVDEQASETPKIKLRDRFKRIKNTVQLIPTMIGLRNRERGEPVSRRQKIAWGLGATATFLGVAYVAHRTGVFAETGGSDSAVLGVSPDMITPDTAVDASLIDQITDSGAQTAQETVSSGSITPESAGIDVTQYSWDVANQLSSGSETEIMQGAIDKYNEIHNTGFELKPNMGTTMIMDGERVISPEQMAELNSLMESAA